MDGRGVEALLDLAQEPRVHATGAIPRGEHPAPVLPVLAEAPRQHREDLGYSMRQARPIGAEGVRDCSIPPISARTSVAASVAEGCCESVC